MTTQTNRIAIALCESAGVKPYYPGKVNRWQWESFKGQAEELIKEWNTTIHTKEQWDSFMAPRKSKAPTSEHISRYIERDRWLAMEALNRSGEANGLGGLIGINQSHLFQGRGAQTVMPALPSDQSGSFVVDTPKRKWWQLW